ncbi:DUF417 family protein [Rodentibacter sp. Ppn85]
MSIVTLSFLITTPETWVPNLGGDFLPQITASLIYPQQDT